MMVNCISFDFDGTICDTQNAIFKTLCCLFPSKNDNEILHSISKGLSLKATLVELSSENVTDNEINMLELLYRTRYNNYFFKYQSLYPYVEETIKELHGMGVLLIVVSNKGEGSIYNFLSESNLLPFISLIVGSRDDVQPKPSIEPWVKIIQKRFPELSLSDVLHVGDTESDIEYANNLNIPCAYMTYGFGKPPSELKIKPDFILSDFNSILEIIH
ncbi:MAG: HAD family hydrolase [Klebsiella michiganensis]|uniref:HAD family hydrolase n=1 Tax=Klebsiella TaxID=570 RepID=UPI001CCDC233|nr:HAD family hydrolase [Klebsiella grimontii]MBZ7467754.1 HAD family hydrolase [Klebsiella grimontii]MDU3694355.1 HAD family hydrolase [Klebsiella michiganensis]MDU3714275.1 HAD family hydrolase [Klebsiella michiganensis]